METTRTNRKPPPSHSFLMAALLFQGISGLVGGIGLSRDPTGRSLDIPLDWLRGSPFDSYLIPGLVLLFALGLFPLVVTYGLWKRRPWSGPSALLVGVMLLVWIAVEILVIGYQPSPPLQLIYGLLGLVITALSQLPTVKRFLNEQAA